ncbi:6-phosphofructo-2-kinase/fructose-2,6-bisphosphatase 1-like isoform X3 [Eriocheir sinensis]|uniref:6-phosphofructo-2-kinase/fructose-2, 6-bisphosphatase 1-like isoform X3 n=2 Tax=Eriocheir sinensis TaxID=95602 RepID=UPI0021CA1865|nr:6-phosphofructo-2-kinase/fructose-2,6-bisphosphatase 1-like isoform X3 [Eriocheir sinensis]
MAPTPTMEPLSGEEEWRRMEREHPVMRMTRNDKEVGMDYVNIPHVVAMVGLPARGKTYIAMKLARYLNWVGLPTKVFNVGDYRRQAIGDYQGHDFFHPRNREGTNVRNKCALDALQDVCEFLQSGGMVAVYDATNTNIERRQLIHHVICERMGYKLFFIESICNDPAIIETNIMECKVTNPDYTNMEKEDAVKDFLKRIEHYRLIYEPLDEEKESKYSFMKIYDAGRRVVVHKQEGHIESRIAYYLMNIHITPRSIYLTRHGESVYNQLGRIGGDSDLSHRGRQYANALAKFISQQNITNLRVWTSCMKRTIQTASGISAPQERWKALNEIDAGICEGLMYEEIQEQYPEEFAARDQNKYSYRYPRGESYEDVVVRLESVIMELERQENVLVVGHQAVLRCVLAYFLDKTGVELPYMKVPLHTIIKLTPQAYGCKVEFFKIPIDCVDTHRSKPVVTRSDEGKEEDMQGAPRGASDIIDGVQVNVLQGLVEGLSVCDNRTVENEENVQGAVGGIQLPESARALWAFMRPKH